MKNIQSYIDPNISSKELDHLTEKILTEKFYQEKKKSWKEKLNQMEPLQKSKTPLKVVHKKKSNRWWLLIAAALIPIVGALTVFWPTPPSANQMAANFFNAEEMPSPQIRKAIDEVPQWRSEANLLFNDGQFEKAILSFEKMEKEMPLTSEDHFFKGLSHFKLGQIETAISNFLVIKSRADEYPKFQRETTWFLALAYIHQNDFEKASIQLKKMKEGTWRNKEATKLLMEIKESSNKRY